MSVVHVISQWPKADIDPEPIEKRNALRAAVTRSPSPTPGADLAERIQFGITTGRWMRNHAFDTVNLDLRNSPLSSLSVEILRFSSLTELNLSHNNFHQVPAVLASMDRLKIVWLHDNPLDKDAFKHVKNSQITFMLDKGQHQTDHYGTSRWLVLSKK